MAHIYYHFNYKAPTKFFDPPTHEEYKVYPSPGRCVLMDQDVTHSVVAPERAAGKEPRYSIVWKLILHPKEQMQNMKLFPKAAETICVGSANNSR